MKRLSWTTECRREELTRHLQPIDDILLERREETPFENSEEPPEGCVAVFSASEGPFRHYRRRLEFVEKSDGTFRLTTTIAFRLAIPFWRFLFNPLVRHRLRLGEGDGSQPWWAPAQRLDPKGGQVLGTVCTLAVLAGYLGTLLSQSISFAADEFGAGVATQGNVLSVVRVGALLALGSAVMADRLGRRPMLLFCCTAACVATLAGAATGSIWMFGVTQILARGFTTAAFVLLAVMLTEEVPPGVRGYALAVSSMAAGLGSGIVVWILPLAGLGLRAWRILFLVPCVALPVLLWAARQLPETRRFLTGSERRETLRAASQESGTSQESGHSSGKHPRRPQSLATALRALFKADCAEEAGRDSSSGKTASRRRRRLALLGVTSLLSAIFAAPASQFLNEYLRTERHFSARDVTVYQLVTYSLVGLGMLASGKLSDSRGRRLIGITCLIANSLFVTLRFLQGGWPMWLWGVLAGLSAGALVPILGAYTTELFGTGLRARSNGQMTVLAVAGSVTGLQLVGNLTERLGGFGPVFALLSTASLLAAVLMLCFFPETAGQELERLNPEDAEETLQEL